MKTKAGYIRLGDAATFLNGFAFKPDHWGESGRPIIRIQNLNNEAADFNYYDGPIPEKYIVHDGDILISWSASLGAYEWKRGEALLNQHIFKVIFDKAPIEKHYLRYAVLGNLAKMEKDAHGATMRHIVKNDFDNTLIPYPSIEGQKRIVNELDLLSGIIEKKNAQLRDLDALALSIYHEMFDEHEEWYKGTVKDVYTFQYGKGNNIPEDKGIYPCYGSNGIVGHHVEYNSDDAPVIGHIGAYAGIVNWASGKHYVTYNGVICRIKGGFDPIYGLYMLKSQDYLNTARRGGAQPFVSYDMLYEPVVFIPPYDLQKAFAGRIAVIDREKSSIVSSLLDVRQMLASRMDYYFND